MATAAIFLIIAFLFVGLAMGLTSDAQRLSESGEAKSELKKVRKEYEALKTKLAELEKQKENEDLVMKWVDPRLKKMEDDNS